MAFTHSGRTEEQHVLIAGADRIGHHTVQVLDEYGHGAHLIERDSEAADQVTGRRTGIVSEGDATDPQILRQTEADVPAITVRLDEWFSADRREGS
ncbi:MAG: NAD-binding protein [Halapricum sp.]